ncbi:MAG: ABC transporter ATP-binding protein, partial [Pedosphaera sp.]|nr:ABC transporter ATP-binding protein [Pedosphaera sp.]
RVTLKGETMNSQNECVPPESRDCSLVFQDYALFPNMTVQQNVAYGKASKNNSELIDRLFDLTKIGDLKNRYPHQISGGEQQRVALVRALATQPSLLLLDEPLSHLDPELRNNVRCELLNIFRVTNTTALFVSHDTEDALTMADQVVVMQKGKAVQIGSPMDVYSDPSNSYAAMLFGKTNLLPRELIPSAPYSFLDEDSGKELVSIRPHQWMVPTSTSNENMPSFAGTIRSVNPKGAYQEIVMETETTLLTIHFPSVFSAVIGDPLTVVFNEGS